MHLCGFRLQTSSDMCCRFCAEFGQSRAECGRISTKSVCFSGVCKSVDVGQTWPNPCQGWPMSVGFAPTSADSEKTWPSSVEPAINLDTLGPSSTELDLSRPKSERDRRGFGKPCVFDKSLLDVGKHRPAFRKCARTCFRNAD